LVAKVLGDDGSGSGRSVAEGIDWACEAGADVLSMSLGSRSADRAIHAAIERAVAAGKFIVCAAGNEGRPDSVDYPARWPQTLSIGAVDRHGRVARFSSRGDQVDVCAPGEDVLSTYLDAGYAKLSGTSMATPFVSGVVALLIAKHRKLGGTTPIDTQAELVEHLRRTATDAGTQGKDPNYGYGLIDPGSVLDIAADEPAESRFEIGPVRVNGTEGTFVFVPR
jgi:major intracellular serine protease